MQESGCEAGVIATDAPHPSTARPTLDVLLVAWMVAGVQTQYHHLRSRLPAGLRIRAIETVPYIEGGRVERLRLPPSVRGTMRSTLTLLHALKGRRVDVVWTQVALPMLPFAVTRGAIQRIPIFYAIDCTPALLWRFGGQYPQVTDPESPKGRLTSTCLRLFFRRCAGLLPWSNWAARSMIRDYGADPETIHVIPPGIDVESWKPAGRRSDSARVRLLFVGADFDRKGGPLLLDLFRSSFRDSCDLHMVTQAPLKPEPHVYLHDGFRPGDPGLLELYRRCDILVLPTLADCFSMAALEAMACGLPVVISRVGGIPEIVVNGETGALVEPGDVAGMRRALQGLVSNPELRRRWGAAGRTRAVTCFSAAAQAARSAQILATAR